MHLNRHFSVSTRAPTRVARRRRVAGGRFVLQNHPMRCRPVKFALLLLVLGAGAISTRPARASLGGDAASVASDAAALRGVARATSLQQFEMQEIAIDNGIRVREFLNKDGIVFAVAWSGPVVPDLRVLLGASFDGYTKSLAALKQPGTHRSVRIAAPELVVESGGHMRAYSGHAYLPPLLPAGVSPADLH